MEFRTSEGKTGLQKVTQDGGFGPSRASGGFFRFRIGETPSKEHRAFPEPFTAGVTLKFTTDASISITNGSYHSFPHQTQCLMGRQMKSSEEHRKSLLRRGSASRIIRSVMKSLRTD